MKQSLVAGNRGLGTNHSALQREFQASLNCRGRPCSNLCPPLLSLKEKFKVETNREYRLHKPDMQHLCKAKAGDVRVENERALEM